MISVCYNLTWIRYLSNDRKVCNLTTTDLYCDNKAYIHMTVSPIFYEKTKHI